MIKIGLTIVCFIVLNATNICFAETSRRTGDDGAAMARAQMMMRQLSQEKEAVQAENSELKKQLASIEKKIASLKQEKTSLDQKLGSSQSLVSRYKENTEMLRDRIIKDNERMKELVEKFKELIAAFKVVEQEKAQLKVTLEQSRQDFLTCAENNVKLVENNEELVHLYMQKGVWASLSQAEPVTQLKQVEVEKIAQKYQNTIDLLKISINEK
jgi:chromosome segregation ATPase